MSYDESDYYADQQWDYFGLLGRMPCAPRGEWACKTSRIRCSK